MGAAVRPAAVAGIFYPGDAAGLRTMLAACLAAPAATRRTNATAHATAHATPAADAVPPAPTLPPGERIKALIVPHAGYVYSGTTAGPAYARLAPLAGSIRRVVLLGPCHRVAVRGLAVPTATAFATPLGEIPLDRVALDALAGLPQVVVSDAAHAEEHSLEVQLPFLQTLLGDFTLLPLAVGDTSAAAVAEVLERLWGGPETLIVVSSDLSHYHAYREARRLDDATVAQLLALAELRSFEQACGALPINGLLAVARRKGLRIERIAQCNSGDAASAEWLGQAAPGAGDRARVVGYASFMLCEVDPGAALLVRARNAIAGRLGLVTRPEAPLPRLGKPGATFVTLAKNGELRGCIGSLDAYRPLDEDVRANAEAAAFRDPRFAPLDASECPDLTIEVSLLTPPQPLTCTDEADALNQLRPGIDGVILEAGGHRATFLPQVWHELPQPREFLAQLKRKAGFAVDDWSAQWRLYRYEVSKWSEAWQA